jgi:hypothetical protein
MGIIRIVVWAAIIGTVTLGVSLAAPKAAAPEQARCIYCGNTARMRCPECKGEGGAKCPDCKKGYVPCAQCGGKGKTKCPKCDGAGKIAGRNWSGQIVYHACSKCNGTGYEKCPACAKNKYRGYVTCPTCNGTGIKGICPTCGGEKTIPCTHCAAGKKLRASLPPRTVAIKTPEKHPDTPPDVVIPGDRHDPATKPDETTTQTASKTPETKPSAPEEPADPLVSADAMIREIASFPMQADKSSDWKDMTPAQQKDAQRQYAKDLAEWNKTHDYHKQRVRWRLSFQAIGPGKKQDLLLLAESKNGAVVGVTLTQKDQALADSLMKDQVIYVSAAVQKYSGGPKDTSNKDDWFNPNEKPYDVLLTDAAIEADQHDADKDPPAKTPATEPVPSGPGPGF